MKLKQLLFCIIFGLTGVNIDVGNAHQFSDFDQSMGITVESKTVTLEYRIWFGKVLAPSLGMDLNQDNILKENELYAFMDMIFKDVLESLAITANNREVKITPLTATISSNGTYPFVSLDIGLWYNVELPADLPVDRHMVIHDNNFPSFGQNQKIIYINSASQTDKLSFKRAGSKTFLDYSDSAKFGMLSPETRKDENILKKERADSHPSQKNALTRFLQTSTIGPAMLFTAFVTAFFLGAGHALSPGHGKAMVAAYLVGTSGRKRDAVILGLIVTFTHVSSVILLGIGVLYLSSHVLPATILPWLSVGSGMLVIFTGFILLIRKAMGKTHHHHEHTSGHDHTKKNTQDKKQHSHHHGHAAGIAGLLSMGIAGGMIPCPSALVVLLVSISLHKIVLGLAMIIMFSLGLASVLVTLGIAVVSITGFSSSVSRFKPVIEILPVISGGLIIFLGTIITLQGLMEAGLM